MQEVVKVGLQGNIFNPCEQVIKNMSNKRGLEEELVGSPIYSKAKDHP